MQWAEFLNQLCGQWQSTRDRYHVTQNQWQAPIKEESIYTCPETLVADKVWRISITKGTESSTESIWIAYQPNEFYFFDQRKRYGLAKYVPNERTLNFYWKKSHDQYLKESWHLASNHLCFSSSRVFLHGKLVWISFLWGYKKAHKKT